MAASERIFKLLDTNVRIADSGTLEADHIESIEFRNVWFAYNVSPVAGPAAEGGDAPLEGADWVLKNVSFLVNRGERLAQHCPTDAGQTTVSPQLPRISE